MLMIDIKINKGNGSSSQFVVLLLIQCPVRKLFSLKFDKQASDLQQPTYKIHIHQGKKKWSNQMGTGKKKELPSMSRIANQKLNTVTQPEAKKYVYSTIDA